jgi:hypothetical protein
MEVYFGKRQTKCQNGTTPREDRASCPRIEVLYNLASLAERQIPNRLAITAAVSRSPQP